MCSRYLNPCFKIKAPLCCPLILKEYLNPRIDPRNGKQTCRLPHYSFWINPNDIFSHISINSQNFLFKFISNLYIPPWLEKIFKFMMFRLQKNALASPKIECIHFYSRPPGKTLLQVLIVTP